MAELSSKSQGPFEGGQPEAPPLLIPGPSVEIQDRVLGSRTEVSAVAPDILPAGDVQSMGPYALRSVPGPSPAVADLSADVGERVGDELGDTVAMRATGNQSAEFDAIHPDSAGGTVWN